MWLVTSQEAFAQKQFFNSVSFLSERDIIRSSGGVCSKTVPSFSLVPFPRETSSGVEAAPGSAVEAGSFPLWWSCRFTHHSYISFPLLGVVAAFLAAQVEILQQVQAERMIVLLCGVVVALFDVYVSVPDFL